MCVCRPSVFAISTVVADTATLHGGAPVGVGKRGASAGAVPFDAATEEAHDFCAITAWAGPMHTAVEEQVHPRVLAAPLPTGSAFDIDK